MSEEIIVRNCSPTLAGIKTGSLFTCDYESEKKLKDDIRKLNRTLASCGVRAIPVKFFENRALIYIYRPKKLSCDLSEKQAVSLLRSCGYNSARADRCVANLVKKLRNSESFPHEIGLFLGYPPEDVKGFIDNRGNDYKLSGYWKVYSDKQRACKLFDKYRKCTEIYCRKCSEGISVKRLTVAV